MSKTAQKAQQIETEFLAGVRDNIEQARGALLPGTSWQERTDDERRRLQDLLAANHRHGAHLLEQMPCNRRITIYGYRRRWWFAKQSTMVAVASVLAPLEHLAAGSPELPPIELGDLVDHLRAVVADQDLPHVIGVCAPSGFSEQVRRSQLALPNVSLVLIEPRGEGQWSVSGLDENLPDAVVALFNPEKMSRKVAEIRREVEQRQADLLPGGVNAAELATRMGVPLALVVELFEQAARDATDLHVEHTGGETRLALGSPAARSSIIDRIRALFDREGDAAAKIEMLAEQRAGLKQRRDRFCELIADLDQQERSMLEQGRQADSLGLRRQLANRLAQVRKEIGRQNAVINMLDSQIDIVSADLHHLTLLQQGAMAKLPDTETLTDNAVRAQQMLERLQEGVDLASTPASDTELGASDEEDAILQEFTATTRRHPGRGTVPTDRAPAEGTAPPEPPAHDRRREAEPEA